MNVSLKNNLPIRNGVIIIAGPDNPYDPPHWWYYVVNADLGHVLDMSNNIMHIPPDQAVHYWVGEWRMLPHESWWKEHSNGLTEEMLYHSGICAGCEDYRFK